MVMVYLYGRMDANSMAFGLMVSSMVLEFTLIKDMKRLVYGKMVKKMVIVAQIHKIR